MGACISGQDVDVSSGGCGGGGGDVLAVCVDRDQNAKSELQESVGDPRDEAGDAANVSSLFPS